MNILLFLETLRQKNGLLWYFGLICLSGAVLCLLLTRMSTTQVLGISAWYKPFKFFLSSAILVWSMGWYLQYLDQKTAVAWYSWALILLLGIENIYITIQAARGQLSHFNLSNGFYAAMYQVMAVSAVGISMTTAAIGISFFTRSFPQLSPAYLWGIRLGLILFVIFSMQGLMMGARLAHSVGGPDGSPGLPVVNWSRTLGDLRIAHFLGMHALQILPLTGFYVFRQARWVLVFGLLYLLLTSAVLVQALRGRPLISRHEAPVRH
jgi:putative Mn2+ efflux pump MntP